MQPPLGAGPPFLGISGAVFISVQEAGVGTEGREEIDANAIFTKGNLCPAFRQIRGGQRIFPVSSHSQLPSA